VLKLNFRSVDNICRLSENEFVVIVTRVINSDKDIILSKIDSINMSLNDEKDGIEPITLITGIAFSDHSRPDGDLLREADEELKKMKC
jgi:GGDEF domain-containing protein